MLRSISIAAVAFIWLVPTVPALAQDSTITYQGQLQEGDQPFSGTANLQFLLFDQLTDGSQVGPTETRTNWPVENGLFQVELDFGAVAFDGSERFLEVWVNGAPLSPRQAVRPAPIALHALNVSAGGEGSTPFSVNADTGTIEYLFDDQVIRFEPGKNQSSFGFSPRIVMGHVNNTAARGGAVVSGGGSNDFPNQASGFFSTVSGGMGNTAGDNSGLNNYSTIGGGLQNTASSFAGTIAGGTQNEVTENDGTIGGGTDNTSSGRAASIVGGEVNTASGRAASVAGGERNTASARGSAVGGGGNNCAGGSFSWAGGKSAKVRPGTGSGDAGLGCFGVPLSGDTKGDNGTFIWADDENADFVSTGANQFLVRAAGGVGINTNAPATNLHLGGLNTDADIPDGIRLENTSGRRWDIHTSAQWLRFNYDSGDGNSSNVAYVNNVDGSWNQLSDDRLKEDVRPLASVLARISALEVVDYNFKHTESDSARYIGLIAQDVAEVFPELASESEDGGYLGVNYAGFSVVALKAIQEQQEIIKAQHDHIAELEARLATIEALVGH
jgi:hypothetical protein